MNLDLAEFQSRVQVASDVHIDDISQQAGLTAVAFNDPSKLKEVLPQRKEAKEEQAKNDFDKFKRDFGGGF